MKLYQLLLTVLLILSAGCSRKEHDERLLGSWISNKEATIERFTVDNPEHEKKLGKEKFEKFKSLFGKLVVTYTPNKCIVKLDGCISEYEYAVIEQGDDYVIIKTADPLGSSENTIKFENGGYWLQAGKGSKLIERFEKIKSDKSLQ